MALKKMGPAVGTLQVTRDRDATKFGSHISVLFTQNEYAALQRLASVVQLSVSGYLRQCVVERWLLARRDRPDGAQGMKRFPHEP